MNLTPRIDKLDQNFIMNGAFNHWQRGSSHNVIGALQAYHTDRFVTAQLGFTTLNSTISQSTDVPTLAESKYHFDYSYQYVVNTSEVTPATAYVLLQQRIEVPVFSPLANENMSFSFWIKSSIVGDYTISIHDGNGLPYQFYKTKVTVNSVSTWEKKLIKIPKMVQPNFSTSPYVSFSIQLSNGTTNQGDYGNDEWVTDHTGQWSVSTQVNVNETNGATVNITGVKLAIDNGDSTDQEFSLYNGSIDSDYRGCQRYYINVGSIRAAVYFNTTVVLSDVEFSVPMRATPTVILKRGATLNVVRSHSSGALVSSTATPTIYGFNVISGGTYTAGHSYHFGYTAEAEL